MQNTSPPVRQTLRPTRVAGNPAFPINSTDDEESGNSQNSDEDAEQRASSMGASMGATCLARATALLPLSGSRGCASSAKTRLRLQSRPPRVSVGADAGAAGLRGWL